MPERTTIKLRAERSMSVTSPAFAPGEAIPRKHTCQGEDVSFAIDMASVPDGTQALALILDDPDAPQGTFTHWTAWNIPPDVGLVPEGADIVRIGGREGQNSFGSVGYRGPCPPEGERHRYYLEVYALREPLQIEANAARDRVEAALQDKILAMGHYMGTYKQS